MCLDVVLDGVHPGAPLLVARGNHVECSGTAVGVGDGDCLASEHLGNSVLGEEILHTHTHIHDAHTIAHTIMAKLFIPMCAQIVG